MNTKRRNDEAWSEEAVQLSKTSMRREYRRNTDMFWHLRYLLRVFGLKPSGMGMPELEQYVGKWSGK